VAGFRNRTASARRAAAGLVPERYASVSTPAPRCRGCRDTAKGSANSIGTAACRSTFWKVDASPTSHQAVVPKASTGGTAHRSRGDCRRCCRGFWCPSRRLTKFPELRVLDTFQGTPTLRSITRHESESNGCKKVKLRSRWRSGGTPAVQIKAGPLQNGALCARAGGGFVARRFLGTPRSGGTHE
jgi:hypothetical protein